MIESKRAKREKKEDEEMANKMEAMAMAMAEAADQAAPSSSAIDLNTSFDDLRKELMEVDPTNVSHMLCRWLSSN